MTAMRTPKQWSTTMPPILASRQKKQNLNTPDLTKLLHVSVTVVSLSGVYFKESRNAKNTDDEALASNPSYPKTTIVASCSRIDGEEDATLDYHARSLPLDLSTASTKDAYREVIRWPTQVKNEKKNASTFHFERCFVREKRGNLKKKGQNLYVAQSCTIQLAVCRNGRWFKLGDADVMITGEEKGEESIAVPLINQDQPKAKKSKSNVIPMARLKGESLACGLGPNAALRVLITVSERPNEENILDDNLGEVVIWEYDPARGAVVEKNNIVKSPAKVDGQAVTILVAPAKGTYETTSDQEEKKAESRATITSDVQAPSVTESTQTNQESRGDAAIAYVPPIRQDSSLSKQEDLPPIRRSSTSSKPEVRLDRITTVDNQQSSPQASASSRALPPFLGFSPVRVSSPMRTLTPIRTSAPVHQQSGTDSLKKQSRRSVLDRVVMITSNSPPAPREGSLSRSNSSSPGEVNDQSVFYIEHDMQPSDEILSSPPAAKDISSVLSRSSITVSTTEQSRSHLSVQSESSEFSPSAFTLARCSTGNTSTFSHSQNSAFTSASGCSLTMCNTDNFSMYSHASDDMSVVMAELLEKTPSELYAIIHDSDPYKARRHRRKFTRRRARLTNGKVASNAGEEEEDCESEMCESVNESTALHERYDESSSYSCIESWSSIVEKRKNGQSVRGNFLTEKARNFGRQFICSIPMCGMVARDDGTLSCDDESVAFLTGKGDMRTCRPADIKDTSSSSSFIGSEISF